MLRRRVGTSGLAVSRLGLGTLTWGNCADIESATAQLATFVDAGGSLVETCDGYTGGESQRMLGDAIAKLSVGGMRREQLVLAGRTDVPPGGLSRGALLAALDTSLARLGTDHLDLWQLPFPGSADPGGLDEALTAVQVAVLSGRVRYAGLVGPRGWQLATAVERARGMGQAVVPVSAQVEYSLLVRAVEGELLAAAGHHGVGLLAWAPLGRGVLTGKYTDGTPVDSRGASRALARYVEARRTGPAARIVPAVLTAADGLGTSPLAVALAWARDRPGVAATIVGARDRAQLAAALASDTLTLPDEIRAALDDVSRPHPPA
ncbi:aldo/keto reductase [Pseudonocardia lacus]|uniref:aldo/keto reductase n=1 Tax=Pseudonocardia lacus TaxID=2835865 RepID=UPI001BDCCA2B|nr:aldo/keto reductase [Pseudonocardia lacus]